ncbi:FAD-dependent oxidoreductase [Phytomonospora sp. NPDC050363]|uniref:NAD(P)/FAD-dependent oxidoreductase n=1 Tax=Phytomonospora sp. NPDC050363 TaxID=3155642 RepID=UPI0033F0580C
MSTPDHVRVPIDMGFIVYNDRTYPHLTRLFTELGVPSQESEMSMSVRCLGCGLEYAGGKRGVGMLARARGSAWPAYLRMLTEIPGFHRDARRFWSETGNDDLTFGRFLADGGYSRYFVDHFALPLVAAVWSAGERPSMLYPARRLFAFLRRHGMLTTNMSIPWRTVTGGSRVYVDRIRAQLGEVREGVTVRTVRRHSDGVDVVDATDATTRFDRVVIATHADQALELLADPTPAEKQILGAFEYSRNEAWLHTDSSLLPSARRTRASWNFLKPRCHGGERALVSYHMNRLMRLNEPVDYVVTLNGAARVDAASLITSRTYQHPIYTAEAIAAQRRLPELTGPRTVYAGAHHGWGFHEDGCVSGVEAAEACGVTWP